MKIVSNPEDVCFEHALEFWTGLLGYVREHSEPRAKHEDSCSCKSCEELAASYLRALAAAAAEEEMSAYDRRALAIMAAGSSPAEQEQYSISLAS